MICIYTYPIHQPDIIISLNNVWIVINRTDSIYTFIQFAYDFIQPNSTTRSFPKKEKKPVSREEEKKTRNWQSLFWKKKKKEKKRKKKKRYQESFARIKKKKKARKTAKRHRFYHDCSWNRSAIARREERKDDGERKEGLKVGRETEREETRKEGQGGKD